MEKEGVKGFGIYVMFLMELRRHDNYKCGSGAIKNVSLQAHVAIKKVRNIVFNFNLFNVNGEGENLEISSPYMDRVMKPLLESQKTKSIAGRKRAENALRTPDGQFTSTNQLEKKRIEEKRTEENTTTNDNLNKEVEEKVIPYWEKYIKEAMQEETWVELQAMSSRIGKIFFVYKEEIFKSFKQHVLIYGTENNIVSLQEAKYYFSNFIREGTKTRKRVLELIQQLEKQKEENNLFRFEQIDEKTGARSYCGFPIPADAPPPVLPMIHSGILKNTVGREMENNTTTK